MKVWELFENFRLVEYRKSEQGEPLAKSIVEDWIVTAKNLNLTLRDKSNKEYILYEYKDLGHDDFMVIVGNKDRDVFGYMWMKKLNNDYLQVSDITVYTSNLGIGKQIYLELIKAGHKLMNGLSLAPWSEKIWKDLPSLVCVCVYDKKKNELEKYSDKPETDKDATDLEKQNFFWVASKEKLI